MLYRVISLYSRYMDKQMPLVEVREALGQRVDAAHYADETTIITKNGQPRAVLVSYEWYRQLTDKLNGTKELG
jgi:prevent-host-death family protein